MNDVRKGFQAELDAISRGIVELGSMVVEMIPRGTQILLDGDLGEAERLIMGDDDVDLLSLELDEQCAQVLALQAPVASDLRRIIVAIHLISEVERSADLVVNIAKGTRRLHGRPLDARLRGLITSMGDESRKLFCAAVDSFRDGDAPLAAALDDMDDVMDALHGDYIEALFVSRQATADLQIAVQLALIGRYYERIADHAVNIGERVVYMVTGWQNEHTGAARARARRDAGEYPVGGGGDSRRAAPTRSTDGEQ